MKATVSGDSSPDIVSSAQTDKLVNGDFEIWPFRRWDRGSPLGDGINDTTVWNFDLTSHMVSGAFLNANLWQAVTLVLTIEPKDSPDDVVYIDDLEGFEILGLDHSVGQVLNLACQPFGRRGTARRAFFRRSHMAKEKRHGTPCPYRWPMP